jgi:hypothetical protein
MRLSASLRVRAISRLFQISSNDLNARGCLISIADLKVRSADVQGIETLTMGLEAGRIMLRWGAGYSASVDAAASPRRLQSRPFGRKVRLLFEAAAAGQRAEAD